MYSVLYLVVSTYYGNYCGCCGTYLDVESAIDRVIELSRSSQQGEEYVIKVIWEINDNV
jgi:hypothetical protein